MAEVRGKPLRKALQKGTTLFTKCGVTNQWQMVSGIQPCTTTIHYSLFTTWSGTYLCTACPSGSALRLMRMYSMMSSAPNATP